jgi:hypothetical protein
MELTSAKASLTVIETRQCTPILSALRHPGRFKTLTAIARVSGGITKVVSPRRVWKAESSMSDGHRHRLLVEM